MKRLVTTLAISAMMLGAVGCTNNKEKEMEVAPETQVTSTTEDAAMVSESESKVYDPQVHGIFLRGIVKEIDHEAGILKLDSEGVEYTVTIKEDAYAVFGEIKEIKVDDDLTVRADYVEDGVTDLQGYEFQFEGDSIKTECGTEVEETVQLNQSNSDDSE